MRLFGRTKASDTNPTKGYSDVLVTTSVQTMLHLPNITTPCRAPEETACLVEVDQFFSKATALWVLSSYGISITIVLLNTYRPWNRSSIESPRSEQHAHPDPSTSSLLAGSAWFILFAAIQLFKGTLASSPQMTILGGFLSSFLFFFAFLCVGNLSKEARWGHVVIALISAEVVAASVHRVCATTCFIFSSVLLGYTYWASGRLHGNASQATTTAASGKKRR
ncbi:putative secreted salivary gland peptide [Planoprotostelium fungivorum]|uniref:Putative secreted salivary gland peptide n=1 Tax=Planoprotostelium fungivorum TaxID=1890364 RepID=A0A2P6N1R7_9EUKA|nr:putative secreted salivary gland peptide [Planoprotostelium fungivorum]